MRAVFLCDDTRIADVAQLCASAGYGIEVQSFYDPAYEADNPDAILQHQKLIRPIAERSFHGPFGDLVAGSFDPMVREVARFRYDHAVETAGELGISRIILHHGYVPGTSLPDGWLRRCSQFWKDFLSDKSPTLQIYLENHLEKNPELILQVLKSIDDLRISACLDIGHVHCCAKGDNVAWITQMKDRISYVHLHDNHGLKDEHLGLGDGTIPLEAVCEALEEHCPNAIWALESKPDRLASSLEWLDKHGLP